MTIHDWSKPPVKSKPTPGTKSHAIMVGITSPSSPSSKMVDWVQRIAGRTNPIGFEYNPVVFWVVHASSPGLSNGRH